MRAKSMTSKAPAERVIKDIRRATRRHFSAEDASRVRKNPGIMAHIRSFAANILRANKVTNMTVAPYRNDLGGLDHLAKYKLM